MRDETIVIRENSAAQIACTEANSCGISSMQIIGVGAFAVGDLHEFTPLPHGHNDKNTDAVRQLRRQRQKPRPESRDALAGISLWISPPSIR